MVDPALGGDPLDWPALALLHAYRAGHLSPVEVVNAVFERIDHFQPRHNAFVVTDRTGALASARASEARWLRKRPAGPVDGLPTTIKDLLDVQGLPTRRGSLTTSTSPASADSASVARLREAGAVIVGKTTTSEFGWKGVTDSPLTGMTRNPWRPELTAGGSSGGAAVAAALGLGSLHLATDGGGSIRIPASFCGVFGFKPTFGVVPIHPQTAAGTLWHQGAISRRVEDAALLLRVISQPDARDFLSLPCPPGLYDLPAGDTALDGLSIGYSADFGFVPGSLPSAVRQRLKSALDGLEAMGATIIEVDSPLESPTELMRQLWCLALAVAIAPLSRQERDQLDAPLRRLGEEGLTMTGVHYRHLEAERGRFFRAMREWSGNIDLLVTPQVLVPPFAAGHEVPVESDYTRWWEWSPFTYPINLTQQPAASIPVGTDDQGLPVSMQLIGPRFGDATVLRVAQAYERYRSPSTRQPPDLV